MSVGNKKHKPRRNRFKKNTQKQRRRWLQRLLLGLKLGALMVMLLAVSALFMVGYAAVIQSDYFRTESIEIGGHSRLTAADVMKQAGLRAGENLLAVNLHLVRKRLLAHPWIAAARVSREIPTTLRIHIKEHTPLAVVDLGRRFLINTQGRIFKEYGAEDPQGLPLVTGIGYTDISLGDDELSPALAAVMHVLAVSRSQSDVLSSKAIERLHYDPALGITLTVRGQRLIRLGADRFETKYRRLEQLWPHLKNNSQWRDFKVVDLNDPDRIVVRLAATP